MRYRPSAIAVVVGLVLGVVLSTAGPADATRNSAGQYSLPSGNPVVSGTTISSSWANNTLADLSVEMTNSLDRQGRGGMLAPLKLANGSASQPSIAWTSDPSSGLYRAGAGDIRMQAVGNQVQQWTSTGTTTTANFTSAGTSTFTGGTTFSGAATFNGVTTLAGTPTATSVFTAGSGGPALALKPGTADHVYQEFYARTATPSTRSGYMGYATAATNELTITNQLAAGDIRLVTPGRIRADANVLLGASNPATTAAFTNTLTPRNVIKAWGKISSIGGGSSTAVVFDGFNVSGASSLSNAIGVGLASPMATTNGVAVVVSASSLSLSCSGSASDPSGLLIRCRDIGGTTLPFPLVNFQTDVQSVSFIVLSAQ